jgi:hypothetical protein
MPAAPCCSQEVEVRSVPATVLAACPVAGDVTRLALVVTLCCCAAVGFGLAGMMTLVRTSVMKWTTLLLMVRTVRGDARGGRGMLAWLRQQGCRQLLCRWGYAGSQGTDVKRLFISLHATPCVQGIVFCPCQLALDGITPTVKPSCADHQLLVGSGRAALPASGPSTSGSSASSAMGVL